MVATRLFALLGSVAFAAVNLDDTCSHQRGGSCADVDVTSALQARRVHHRVSRQRHVSATRVVEQTVANKEGLFGSLDSFNFDNMFVDKKSIEQLDSELKDLTQQIEDATDFWSAKSLEAHQKLVEILDSAIPPEIDLQETYDKLVAELEEAQEKVEKLEAKARQRFETLSQKLQNTVSDVVDDAQEEFDKWTAKLEAVQTDMVAFFERTQARFESAKINLEAAITTAAERFDAKVADLQDSAQEFKTHLSGQIDEALDEAAATAMATASSAVEVAVRAEEWTTSQIKKLTSRAEQLEKRAQEKLVELSVVVRDQRMKAEELYNAAKGTAQEKLTILKTKAKDTFEEVQTKMSTTYDEISTRAQELFADTEAKIEAGINKIKQEASDFTDKASDFKDQLEAAASEAVQNVITEKRQQALEMKEKLVKAYSETTLKLEEMIMDKVEAVKEKIEVQVADAKLKWEAAQQGFVDSVDQTTDALKAAYDALEVQRQELLEKFEEAKQKFEEEKKRIEAAIADAKDATKEVLNEIGDAFKELGDSILNIFR